MGTLCNSADLMARFRGYGFSWFWRRQQGNDYCWSPLFISTFLFEFLAECAFLAALYSTHLLGEHPMNIYTLIIVVLFLIIILMATGAIAVSI